MPDTSIDWKPLEQAVGEKARHFMFMGYRDSIRLYKHCDTRRYLNLDPNGQAYVYNSRENDYFPVSLDTAITHAFS